MLVHLLVQAMTAEYENLSLSFMSAWMVGKVEAPAKANMMVEKALNVPPTVGGSYLTTCSAKSDSDFKDQGK